MKRPEFTESDRYRGGYDTFKPCSPSGSISHNCMMLSASGSVSTDVSWMLNRAVARFCIASHPSTPQGPTVSWKSKKSKTRNWPFDPGWQNLGYLSGLVGCQITPLIPLVQYYLQVHLVLCHRPMELLPLAHQRVRHFPFILENTLLDKCSKNWLNHVFVVGDVLCWSGSKGLPSTPHYIITRHPRFSAVPIGKKGKGNRDLVMPVECCGVVWAAVDTTTFGVWL